MRKTRWTLIVFSDLLIYGPFELKPFFVGSDTSCDGLLKTVKSFLFPFLSKLQLLQHLVFNGF